MGETAPIYTEALKRSGFNQNFKFNKDKEENNKNKEDRKKRSRKITWFNPPFSYSVSTNVAKTFLSMIDRDFPKTNKLHKIFNRNTVKVSYSCMPNVNLTIQNHNKKLLQQHRNEKAPTETTCNCRQKENCPLKGHYLTKCIVYKATVTETKTNKQETYVGLTENTFKTRFNQHKSSFKLEHKKASTSLSEHIWALKDKDIDYKIEWQILKKTRPYMPGKKTCPLCLEMCGRRFFRIVRIEESSGYRTHPRRLRW
ncbi:hypothetical protein ElyMa_006489000 [Elysia marginata]|uniref:GIY-YIG domain-containing protein n=1 Tax=Elysia marginata TaxID=1093978 RepID=A0AAV4I151_9GAST|nr:hypothetical protein ElyMa_006489000 [Elysia marginata]